MYSKGQNSTFSAVPLSFMFASCHEKTCHLAVGSCALWVPCLIPYKQIKAKGKTIKIISNKSFSYKIFLKSNKICHRKTIHFFCSDKCSPFWRRQVKISAVFRSQNSRLFIEPCFQKISMFLESVSLIAITETQPNFIFALPFTANKLSVEINRLLFLMSVFFIKNKD